MASVVYDSYFDGVNHGVINPATDTFKAMLVTSAYTEDKAAHIYRSSIVGEVTGVGYVAGGVPCLVTVVKDVATHRMDVLLGAVSWANSTLTGRKLIVYKSRGGAAGADELVACVDFGADVSSTAATLSVSASTIRVQN